MQHPLNALTAQIIGVAIEVHRELGPGLLESVYDSCLSYALIDSGLAVERQTPLPLVFRGLRLDCGYRIDPVVANAVIIEGKAVEKLLPVHAAQLLSYLRVAKLSVGLLFNFNVRRLTDDGLQRVVNGFPDR